MCRRLAAALLALGLGAAGARAEQAAITPERIEALERRIEALEEERDDLRSQLRESRVEEGEAGLGVAEWTRRVRLSGSLNTGYYSGQDASAFHDQAFQVEDTRFFVDADLGRDVDFEGTPLLRDLGLHFEWNLVRLGDLVNDVGEAYVDAQGIGGARWLNAQVGRFQIPVGENYLLFGPSYRYNPFITNTVGGPWWWDEGVRIYGSLAEGRFGWVASVSDGETPFDEDASQDVQGTLKLYGQPLSWLYLSASALRSGQIGSSEAPASGALWLGETWATAFGSLTGVPNFQDGVPIPDGPAELDHTTLYGVDAILTHPRFGRLWLAYGRYAIDSSGASRYDRNLHYWIAQWVIPGSAFAPELAPGWLALRANGLGTYDRDEGYVLDVRQAWDFGYNARAIDAFSVALGWNLTSWATLRAEWTHQDIDLVRGVPSEWRDLADEADYFGVEIGAAF